MDQDIKIDPKFFNVFGAWFNVDLIDLDDLQEVRSVAGTCASDLSKQIPDLDTLIADLSRMLEQWNPQIVMQFMNVTDVDWLFSEQTEQTLKYVIAEVITGLRYFRQNSA